MVAVLRKTNHDCMALRSWPDRVSTRVASGMVAMTIESLLIYPPLAIARLGSSETPLDSFRWGEDQTTAHGTGKTTISPALTFRVADDGRVTSYLPDKIQFKDSQGFRPVCPFFELHSRYSDSSGRVAEAPVTPALLKDHGLRLSQLTWLLHVA